MSAVVFVCQHLNPTMCYCQAKGWEKSDVWLLFTHPVPSHASTWTRACAPSFKIFANIIFSRRTTTSLWSSPVKFIELHPSVDYLGRCFIQNVGHDSTRIFTEGYNLPNLQQTRSKKNTNWCWHYTFQISMMQNIVKNYNHTQRAML